MDETLGLTILGSGSKGNSSVVHTDKDALLVDAGFSCKEFRRRLASTGISPEMFRGILVTHEHTDHVCGLRCIANYLKVPIYATSRCADKLRHHDGKLQGIVRYAVGTEFQLGGITVTSFAINHDAVEPVGYTFQASGAKVAIATDLGIPSVTVEYNLRDCNTLMLESNHDLNMLAASSRPWTLKQRILGPFGHLSNPTASQLLERILAPLTRNLVLAHISQECNTPELALRTMHDKLQQLGRTDVCLCAAAQDMPTKTLWA